MDADCDRSSTHSPAQSPATAKRNQTAGFTPSVINFSCVDYFGINSQDPAGTGVAGRSSMRIT
jgi:hypothetical protein